MAQLDQQVFNILVALCGGLGGWLMKVMWDSLHELRAEDKLLADKVNAIEVLVVGDYVKREELNGHMKEIKEMFTKIFDKLDGKADKTY